VFLLKSRLYKRYSAKWWPRSVNCMAPLGVVFTKYKWFKQWLSERLFRNRLYWASSARASRSHSYSARPLRYALLKTRCNTSFWSWVINTRNKPAKRTEFINDDGFINRVKCKYIYFNFIYLLNLSVQPEKDKKLINSADIRRNKKRNNWTHTIKH